MIPLIYDCEIIKAIPSKDAPVAGIEYCAGWDDYDNMGVSVIGYQIGDEQPSATLSVGGFLDILLQLETEEVTHVLVGFNSKNFDDKLLAANGLKGVVTEYDLLEELRIAAGFEADYKSVPAGYSYRLDAVAKANGMAKTGRGDLAPVLWQQGKEQEVIDYCLNDVRITKSLLDLGLNGDLIDPNTGDKLRLTELPIL